MIFTPLAPQVQARSSTPAQIESSQAALTLDPSDFVFTNTASVVGGKPRAEAGDTLRYNLTLTNNGADAQGVIVQDPLGPNLSLVPGSLEVTPLAYDQSLTTPEDTPLDLMLTGSDGDGDSLAFSVTAGPTHGSLSGTAPNLTYTPTLDFTGVDSITFVVNDGSVDSPSATVSSRWSCKMMLLSVLTSALRL
ncbi:MAG: Ig-like domain-containing protein [Bellilinea sp.]